MLPLIRLYAVHQFAILYLFQANNTAFCSRAQRGQEGAPKCDAARLRCCHTARRAGHSLCARDGRRSVCVEGHGGCSSFFMRQNSSKNAAKKIIYPSAAAAVDTRNADSTRSPPPPCAHTIPPFTGSPELHRYQPFARVFLQIILLLYSSKARANKPGMLQFGLQYRVNTAVQYATQCFPDQVFSRL